MSRTLVVFAPARIPEPSLIGHHRWQLDMASVEHEVSEMVAHARSVFLHQADDEAEFYLAKIGSFLSPAAP
ncbi:MAG: hypothetical protein AAF998_27695 [Bacteroidota bacterium]